MKIRIIAPIITDQFNSRIAEEAKQFAAPDTEIDVVNIEKGAASIESAYDEVLNCPDIVRMTVQAEKDGFDAVFVTCFGDPGVDAARELVKIPVAGGFQPAVLTACLLSGRFSIVTVLPSVVPMLRNLVRKQGIGENAASIRCVNIAVPVVDPTGAAIGFLQSLYRNSISHSRRTYHYPPDKERNI